MLTNNLDNKIFAELSEAKKNPYLESTTKKGLSNA